MKVFNHRVILEGVSFVIRERQVLLITGRNGAGKSTLLKLLAHILTPTQGSIQLSASSREDPSWQTYLGFVSPYLTLYEEFTARENLELALTLRGIARDAARADRLLQRFSLGTYAHTPVRWYSTGMKQRLKYAFALMHRPPLLLLDEPMTNLDHEGTALVRELMAEQQQEGLLVVATNEPNDIDTPNVQIHLNGGQ